MNISQEQKQTIISQFSKVQGLKKSIIFFESLLKKLNKKQEKIENQKDQQELEEMEKKLSR